jgi:hypothetical protein
MYPSLDSQRDEINELCMALNFISPPFFMTGLAMGMRGAPEATGELLSFIIATA